MTTAERLLQQVDRLAHPERQRLIAATARSLAGTADLRTLLDGLHEQGPYGRRLGLQVACIAGDPGFVERCLDAPEQSLRVRAIAAAVKLALPHTLLVERLPQLPVAHRAVLYRAVRGRAATTGLAEALLPIVREQFGDREAAGLLPAVSHEQVARLLPDLDHAVANWASLGRRHPDQLLSYVEGRLTDEPRALWSATWTQLGPAVAAAMSSDPGRVLDLLERSVAHAPFPSALAPRAGELARFDSSRLVRILTDPRRLGEVHVGRKVLKGLVKNAPDADLVDLGRSMDETHRLVPFLHALPPSRRPFVHRAVVGSREPELWAFEQTLQVLDELPSPAREEEARRLLALRSVADDPYERLAVTARLDWATARPPLTEAARRPDPHGRAHAYALLVRAAAATREPAVVADFLRSLDRYRNDQDVVKGAVLSALATVPPWLFRDSDAAHLGGLLVEAMQARDNSWATTSAVRSMCDRLLREGTLGAKPQLVQAALDGLQLLAGHGSSLDLSGIDRDLPRGAEVGILEALLPRIEADAARGEFGVALALARGLGRRAWELPRLQSYVDRARSATSDHVVREALSLWLAPPATRDERAALALKGDRSTITLPAVANVVAWRRTDLLDEVLRRSMHGRFLKRGVRFLPQFQGCFDRWLPRQVAAYSALLVEVAGSAKLPVWERVAAIRSLGQLDGNAATLRALVADPDVSIAEAAIAALARTDDPTTVLPDLVALAQTDRARVAVPAITRAVRFLAPGDLTETLRPLLVGAKITSRKEGARLLAEHQVPGAAELLIDTFDRPDQHRDVRRAAAAAARFHLADPIGWELLDRAVRDPEVASAVLDVAVGTVARRDRPAYAVLVERVATTSDPDVALLGLAALPAWLPWRPEAVDLLVATVQDLSHSATWRAALTALAVTCAITGRAAPLAALATSLAELDDDSLDGPDRDRPAHQRLSALVEATLSAVSGGRHRSLATEAGEALVDLHRRGAIRLLAAGLDFESVSPIIGLCALADRPHLAALASNSVAQAFAQVVRRLPGRALDLLSELPTDSTAGGLVALSIAATAGPVEGWPADLQAVVRQLRGHDDLDVRDAALDVVLTPE